MSETSLNNLADGAQPNARPNVLMICVDQWPAALQRAEGHPSVVAPTLHQLASNGIRFTRAYSTCPVCGPARRSLMTGLGVQSQGPRENLNQPMPAVTTLAQAFTNSGYHTTAIGKLHAWPPRARLGFSETRIAEEGRCYEEGRRPDDYELYLADQGFAGQYHSSGMAQNDYLARPWHLSEHCHPTHWAATEMCRAIQRRDPTRPAFWYLSFAGPHPPLMPLCD
ncbi:MAG: sulfatase-like hydrolase/transferase, partial [Chloroflexota bacterium]